MTKTIFITVGTTLFQALIKCVTAPLFLNHMASLGYDRLIIQYGKGRMPTLTTDVAASDKIESKMEKGTGNKEDQKRGIYKISNQGKEYNENDSSQKFSNGVVKAIEWEMYRFKPSLEEDMSNADLIISHAGAGSIMEGLEHCRKYNSQCGQDESHDMKKLVVVINDILMDNHQCELAYALEKRNFLYVLSKPDMLLQTEKVQRIEHFLPVCFEGGDDSSFGSLLDDFMGYSKVE